MKTVNKNLCGKIVCAVVASLVFACFTPAMAAVGNGCDVEDNVYINPKLALCSTHVYNIGSAKNPSDEGTRQLMQDVVALKTTVITQQMYKQYEYLDATVRRLKTQLKKAILQSKLEVAGASSDGSSDSSSSGSYNRNIILNGASDCSSYSSTSETLKCLQTNLAQVRNAVASNNIGEARKQLEKDLKIATTWNVWTIGSVTDDITATGKSCAKVTSLRGNGLSTCVDTFNQKLAQKVEAVQKENAVSNPYYRPY